MIHVSCWRSSPYSRSMRCAILALIWLCNCRVEALQTRAKFTGEEAVADEMSPWAGQVFTEISVKEAKHQDPQVITYEFAKTCSFEIVTMDTRYADPTGGAQQNAGFSSGGGGSGGYWMSSAILNYKYAKRNGYGFRAAKVVSPVWNVTIPWHKIWYMRRRVQELLPQHQQRCGWLLYLDSDAFIREADLALPDFLARLGRVYGLRKDAAMVFAQEQVVPPIFTELTGGKAWLNGGVLLMQISQSAVEMAESIIRAGRALDEEYKRHHLQFRVFETWPAEQGVLTQLWNSSLGAASMSYAGMNASAWRALRHRVGFKAEQVGVTGMLEMNSPWGRFIEHQWSGVGEQRWASLRDASMRAGLTREDHQEMSRLKTQFWHDCHAWNATKDILLETPPSLQPPHPD
eukprot:CAMPEP_0178460068 /NCGR_PEP_ID=MMETSP0689_2-20121128/48481_1 /TAXON_ID=160604 /ORGANISM="Amphidinium massartii, Strain CS-259" /LENGTH=402 /DNA_ID=CAMNT_0020086617 /DNA_START=1 /DNA_END=1209 /DNA_ORIENTATION=+